MCRIYRNFHHHKPARIPSVRPLSSRLFPPMVRFQEIYSNFTLHYFHPRTDCSLSNPNLGALCYWPTPTIALQRVVNETSESDILIRSGKCELMNICLVICWLCLFDLPAFGAYVPETLITIDFAVLNTSIPLPLTAYVFVGGYDVPGDVFRDNALPFPLTQGSHYHAYVVQEIREIIYDPSTAFWGLWAVSNTTSILPLSCYLPDVWWPSQRATHCPWFLLPFSYSKHTRDIVSERSSPSSRIHLLQLPTATPIPLLPYAWHS